MFDSIKKLDSSDTNVSKFVFTSDDVVAEAVLYKYPTFEERTVICCSTQSGCPVGCRFCGAGNYFIRSLTAEEIAYQVIYLVQSTGVQSTDMKKLQVMFMSMGEPMYNFDELSKAIAVLGMKYPSAALLISTSAPRNFKAFESLNELSQRFSKIGLQFSVHESTDEERRKLIPSATMTLKEISDVGFSWHLATGRKPYFNYCAHDKNSSSEDADRLYNLFDPEVWECTISVICEKDESVAAANERQRSLASNFSSLMLERGFNVRVFNPAGQDDIGGGCGQLWYVQSWMKNNPDKVKKSKGFGLHDVHTPTLN